MWTDKKGVTHVSDQPPKEDAVNKVVREFKNNDSNIETNDNNTANRLNICSYAYKIVNDTEVDARVLFREHVQGYEFTGVGEIAEIKTSKNSLLEFYIRSCNNRLIVNLFVKHTTLNTGFKIGQSVKFRGKCKDMKKSVFRDTYQKNAYILLDNADVWSSVNY
jgi:RecG-like helicase